MPPSLPPGDACVTERSRNCHTASVKWRYSGRSMKRIVLALAIALSGFAQQLPHATPNGYELPNGWRLTPLGRAIQTEDMVLNVSMSPDRKAVIALHSGFNPHGLVVVDPQSEEAVQRIRLKSA